MTLIMSRRKQSNPKPLIKRDDEEGTSSVNHVGEDNEEDRNSIDTNQMEGVEEDDNKTVTSASGSDRRPSLSHTPMDEDEDGDEYRDPGRHDNGPETSNNHSSSHNSRVCDLRSPSNGSQSMTGSSAHHSPKPESPAGRSQRSDSLDHLDRSVIQSPASSVASDTMGSLQASLKFPTLRLNAQLASDPALQPDAKTLKAPITIKVEPEEQGNISILPSPILAAELRAPVVDKSSVQQQQHKVIEVAAPPRIPIFMCTPCGIRFSSLSTLEAHQTYYCTHRKDADEASGGGGGAGAGSATAGNASGKHPLKAGEGTGSGSGSLEPPMKSIRTGKQYACNQCSYSADKKVSLNRHKRMHQTSPTPSSTTSNGGDFLEQAQAAQQQQLVQGLAMTVNQLAQVDRYCSDCDIRFNSTKTYRAHKQHYCSSRHREGQNTSSATTTPKSNVVKSGSVSPPEASASPAASSPAAAYVALPTSPILIIPCSVLREARFLPGPLSTMPQNIQRPEETCFMLQNNILTPIAQSLAATAAQSQSSSPPVAENSSKSKTPSPEEEAKHQKALRSIAEVLSKSDFTIPLDLSIRRFSSRPHRDRSLSFSSAISGDVEMPMGLDLLLMEGKENMSVTGSDSAATPEQIVCAPSLPGSPPLTPSPKRRSNSPRVHNNMSPTSQHAALIRAMPPELSIHFPAAAAAAVGLLDPKVRLPVALLNHAANVMDVGAKKSQLTPPLLRLQHSPSPTQLTQASSVLAPAVPQSAPVPPQIFVKQGMSKCKECNIVFCQYENYVAHKKHYCSARNLDGGSGVDGSEGASPKVSPPPTMSPQPVSPSLSAVAVAAAAAAAAASSTVTVAPVSTGPQSAGSGGGVVGRGQMPQAVPYQQLICAACGTKFTSLDNLGAHQMYYCSKRVELNVQPPQLVAKEKCGKCKTVHDPAAHCPSTSWGYKCPICDVVSANSAESRRHMETHGGVKAFRCTICSYKGNTLRGMRTHIRMHFEKKSQEFNEENYITCILENDETIEPAGAVTNDTQIHRCDVCNFTANSKANVIKHIKMVHSPKAPRELMSPPLVPEKRTSPPAIVNGRSSSDGLREIPIKVTIPASSGASSSTMSFSVKIEPTDDDLSDNEPELVIDDDHVSDQKELKAEIKEPKGTSNERHTPMITPPAATVSDLFGIANLPRRCENCDIKFTYLKSYLAHKEFYCKERNNNGTSVGGVGAAANKSVTEGMTSPSPSNGLSSTVTNSRAAEVQ